MKNFLVKAITVISYSSSTVCVSFVMLVYTRLMLMIFMTSVATPISAYLIVNSVHPTHRRVIFSSCLLHEVSSQ